MAVPSKAGGAIVIGMNGVTGAAVQREREAEGSRLRRVSIRSEVGCLRCVQRTDGSGEALDLAIDQLFVELVEV